MQWYISTLLFFVHSLPRPAPSANLLCSRSWSTCDNAVCNQPWQTDPALYLHWRNTSLPIRVGPNYFISNDDFSLTILHTTLSDAGTDWSCHVTVDNPQTRRINDWHLDSNSTTLVVYGKHYILVHVHARTRSNNVLENMHN